MDTLGIEPRASRMLSGCDTTTPCAQMPHEISQSFAARVRFMDGLALVFVIPVRSRVATRRRRVGGGGEPARAPRRPHGFLHDPRYLPGTWIKSPAGVGQKLGSREQREQGASNVPTGIFWRRFFCFFQFRIRAVLELISLRAHMCTLPTGLPADHRPLRNQESSRPSPALSSDERSL